MPPCPRLLLSGLLAAIYLSSCGIFKPCQEACDNLWDNCQIAVASTSYLENERALCRRAKDVRKFEDEYCLKSCFDRTEYDRVVCWKDIQCKSDDPGHNIEAVNACNEGEKKENKDSQCRNDCLEEARVCGAQCVDSDADESGCASCFNSCDNDLKSCRDRCNLFG